MKNKNVDIWGWLPITAVKLWQYVYSDKAAGWNTDGVERYKLKPDLYDTYFPASRFKKVATATGYLHLQVIEGEQVKEGVWRNWLFIYADNATDNAKIEVIGERISDKKVQKYIQKLFMRFSSWHDFKKRQMLRDKETKALILSRPNLQEALHRRYRDNPDQRAEMQKSYPYLFKNKKII